MMTALIYKILDSSDWQRFQANGVYDGSTVDLADGYIHFSTLNQLARTLALHYARQAGLILLAVDTGALDKHRLKWEEARGGQLFPHLYIPLPIKAVTAHWPLPLDRDHVHILPKDLSG